MDSTTTERTTRRMDNREGDPLPCGMCPYGGTPDYRKSLCVNIAKNILFSNMGDEECTIYQTESDAHNCCTGSRSPPPQIQDSCELCAEGGMPNLGQQAYPGTSCSDLSARANVISNTTRQCYLLQLQGARFCGCPSEGLRKCNLCAGDAGDEFLYADNPVNVNGEVKTCNALHESIAESDNDCPTIQAHGYFNCGCSKLPNVTEKCSLCYVESDAYTDNVFNEEEYGTDYRCSDFQVDLFAAKGDECTKGQAEAALRCGCQSKPPPAKEPFCTLCPGGLDPELGDREVPEFGVTCQFFSDVVPLLYDGNNCHSLENIRNLCQCPTEAKCRLCNFGDLVVDETKIVTGPTQDLTCAEVDNAAQFIQLGSSISSFQEQCQNYRTEFASACCPGSSIEPLVFDFPSQAPSPPPVNGLQSSFSGGTTTTTRTTVATILTTTLLLLLTIR